jgi:hypothetical protein
MNISPDHTSVKRWLDGVQPHGDTIRCIASALGTKLGRVVTYEEIGFSSAVLGSPIDLAQEAALYPAEPSRAVDLLDGMTAADISDDGPFMSTSWDPARAPSVITGYLFSAPSWHSPSEPQSGHDGRADRIRATVRSLTILEFQYGGGHTRRMLLSYWRSEIIPALRSTRGGPVQRDLFAAAADAAEVLGWSAYDAGRHGAAQRYLTQGLRLAYDADDPLMGGQILSNLSHQANYLGNFNEAVHFARAAQNATRGRASKTVTSMFLAMEARALASLGDAAGCAAALNRAEKEFANRHEVDDPAWISYFDALELAGETAHCFRDLGHARKAQLFAAQAVDPVLTPARTQSFLSLVHADGALAEGNLDEAMALATQSVQVAGLLQSSRQQRYLADFCRALTAGKHLAYPAVREFAETLASRDPNLMACFRN